MSHAARLMGDGSSTRDSQSIVQVDRSKEPYRWVCPNGHPSWSATNYHIWCRSCRRQAENGADVHPEHWGIIDKKTGELIPWDAIRVVDE